MNLNIAVVATKDFLSHEHLCDHLRKLRHKVSYCCDSFGTFIEAWAASDALDILILGIKDHSGFEQLFKIKHLIPNIQILVFTDFKAPAELMRALNSGANGYYLAEEGLEVLEWAIKKIMLGGVYIAPELNQYLIEETHQQIEKKGVGSIGQEFANHHALRPREVEIANLLIQNLAYKEIAQHLFLSINTVRHYVKSLYKKLNISNRSLLKDKVIEVSKHQQR